MGSLLKINNRHLCDRYGKGLGNFTGMELNSGKTIRYLLHFAGEGGGAGEEEYILPEEFLVTKRWHYETGIII